jgi:hypothetical protein
MKPLIIQQKIVDVLTNSAIAAETEPVLTATFTDASAGVPLIQQRSCASNLYTNNRRTIDIAPATAPASGNLPPNTSISPMDCTQRLSRIARRRDCEGRWHQRCSGRFAEPLRNNPQPLRPQSQIVWIKW